MKRFQTITAVIASLALLAVVFYVSECRRTAYLQQERATRGQTERLDRDGAEEDRGPLEDLRQVPQPPRGPDTCPDADNLQPHPRVQANTRRAGECRTFLVTAYCPCKKCCGPKACGVTASGAPVSANGGHFVAADPRIAFGTRIRIAGYAGGVAVPVLDTGGAIKGNRLDVFFGGPDGHKKALEWGVKTLVCEVQAAKGAMK